MTTRGAYVDVGSSSVPFWNTWTTDPVYAVCRQLSAPATTSNADQVSSVCVSIGPDVGVSGVSELHDATWLRQVPSHFQC